MKQRRIKELQVYHYENGGSLNYYPSRTEEYASILAQAEAHQDLRFHTESDGVETLIILPWESVIGVYATYETADVAAPTDTICNDGGESGGTLEVTLEEAPGCYIMGSGNCKAFFNPANIISEMTLNGEDVFAAWKSAGREVSVVSGTDEGDNQWSVPADCDAESVEVTITYLYEGASTTVTVTLTPEIDG